MKTKIALVALIMMTLSSLLPGGGRAFAQDKIEDQSFDGPFVRHRVLVRFRSDVSEDQVFETMRASGALRKKEISGLGIVAIELPEDVDEEAYVQEMRSRADVEFAELDRILPPADMNPNDPMYSSQWHLPIISAPSAWSTSVGSSNVIIAIIDTGVEATHPDLAGKLVPGWNFYDNNDNTSDVYGHGTPVAGSAAAMGNNSVGVASVAWDCKIMPLRVSATNGYASVYTMATALTWAADHGARVANISYAASAMSSVITAAEYFQSKGGVVTISAGNTGTLDANTDNPYALTVSATTSTDAMASFSTFGPLVDVAAPGAGVYSTVRGGAYGSVSGTSFSAPIVAGLAGLVMSANPALNGAQVQDVIKQSADDLGSAGRDDQYGWGRINAARAVQMALSTTGDRDTQAPTVSILAPTTGATVSGTVNLQASASDNTTVASVSFSIDGTALGTVSKSPYTLSWNSLSVANGSHVLMATATDQAGNTASVGLNFTVSNIVDLPPVAAITSPANGSSFPTTTRTVTVTASATDETGVTSVELYVDGKRVATSRKAPYSLKWDVRRAANGAHTLVIKAYDRAGNCGVSPSVTVYKGSGGVE
ncbi:MAG: S8 family serine peptidase [Acidobacteriota bacterium]